MRNQTFHTAAFVLGCILCALPGQLQAQGPVPDSPAIEQRVDAMIAKLTLEQKLDLIGGLDNMFIRAEPSASFPMLRMSDGPEGVRTWGPDTAYAGGIALAAAWDPNLANQMGESIGKDARARGVNFLLGPGVNIYRAPMNGRNFEYLGEDPYLSGQTAAAYIRGVQSEGVIATVKHFAANNEEYDRHNVSSDMDERTLREIYLPAFEAAVASNSELAALVARLETGAAAAGRPAARGAAIAFMREGKTAVPATMYQVMKSAQMKAPAA